MDTTTTNNKTVLDVLSGKEAVKFEVAVDYKSTAMLAIALFVVVVIAGLIIKRA